MKDKTKGWLMLIPFILSYIGWMWHMSQWEGLLICVVIPIAAWYFAKAIELTNRR